MNPLQEAREMQEQIVAWRRDLHRIPECGLVLPKTAAYVQARLAEMGIEYKTYEAHSGIVAVIGSGEGKVVAIRADMDGLNLSEKVDIPFRSENENMHACGHDAHTAILLAAAKVLKAHEAELPGRVKLLFQPGEEGPGGAALMVRDGVLEDPRPDCILALHVMVSADRSAKPVQVSYSNMFAADDQLYIKVTGKGAHGSQPDKSVDPVTVSAQIISALQLVVSRELSPLNPGVITIASMTAGRGTYNIIPETAEIKGTIRVVDMETRAFVLKRISAIAKGVAAALRAECDVQFLDGYPALINNPEVVKKFLASAQKIVAPGEIEVLERPIMGGEDAAFFFERIPGAYFFLDATAPGEVYPAHSSGFYIAEESFYIGAALFLQAAIDFMLN